MTQSLVFVPEVGVVLGLNVIKAHMRKLNARILNEFWTNFKEFWKNYIRGPFKKDIECMSLTMGE